jgi:hypothetical protein
VILVLAAAAASSAAAAAEPGKNSLARKSSIFCLLSSNKQGQQDPLPLLVSDISDVGHQYEL